MCELDINPKKVKEGQAVKDIAECVDRIKKDQSPDNFNLKRKK